MNGEREDHGLRLWILPAALMLFIGLVAAVASLVPNSKPAAVDESAEFEAQMRRDDPEVVGVVFQAVDDLCACKRRACADAILEDRELETAMAKLVERQTFEQWPHRGYTRERSHIWRAHVSAKLKQGDRCARVR